VLLFFQLDILRGSGAGPQADTRSSPGSWDAVGLVCMGEAFEGSRGACGVMCTVAPRGVEALMSLLLRWTQCHLQLTQEAPGGNFVREG
jgi:hypothetical protein